MEYKNISISYSLQFLTLSFFRFVLEKDLVWDKRGLTIMEYVTEKEVDLTYNIIGKGIPFPTLSYLRIQWILTIKGQCIHCKQENQESW